MVQGSDILSQCLWHNEQILLNKKPFVYPHYAKLGITYVNDLIDTDGKIYTYQKFYEQTKNYLKTNFLEYASLVTAVKQYYNTYSI